MKTTLLRLLSLLACAAFAHGAEDWPPKLFYAMYGPKPDEQLEKLKALIEDGADVNAPILFDRMLREGEKPSALKGTAWPLDAAVQQSRVGTVIFLLASGAKTHGAEMAQANLRGTPEESLAITRALLLGGADVNARDDSFSALFWASYKAKKSSVKLLLSQPGIQLDQITNDGDTALLAAVSKGHADIVELLIKAGADAAIANKAGETALTLSRKNTNPEKREALLAALKAAK